MAGRRIWQKSFHACVVAGALIRIIFWSIQPWIWSDKIVSGWVLVVAVAVAVATLSRFPWDTETGGGGGPLLRYPFTPRRMDCRLTRPGHSGGDQLSSQLAALLRLLRHLPYSHILLGRGMSC